jgi:hypothetical protein
MQQDKYLLTEYTTFNYDLLKEQVDGSNNGSVMMKGILQRAGVLNQNKRVYPKHILEREVKNYMKVVKENRAVGELDHPSESVIELKNVSHIIKELWWENDDLWGKLEVLSTPSGKILQSLVESGVRIGISSRGVGSLTQNGNNNVVEDDYVLICWDIVSEPSTPGAFIMKEGRVIRDDSYMSNFTKADKLHRILNKIESEE